MNNNRKSQHSFIHVIFGKSSAALNSLSMNVSRRLNVRFNLAKTVLLVLFIVLVDISEHYNCSIFHGEIDEELFECAMYFEML